MYVCVFFLAVGGIAFTAVVRIAFAAATPFIKY